MCTRVSSSWSISLNTTTMIDTHWTRLHLVERGGEKDVGVVEKMEVLQNCVKKMKTPYQL